MIDDVTLHKVYSNKHTFQLTLMFYKENNMLYGTREEKEGWKFSTWSSYSDPNNTHDVVELNEKEKKEMEEQTFKSFWRYPAEYLK